MFKILPRIFFHEFALEPSCVALAWRGTLAAHQINRFSILFHGKAPVPKEGSPDRVQAKVSAKILPILLSSQF